MNSTISRLTGLGILLVVIGHSDGLLPDRVSALANSNYAYYLFIHFIEAFYFFHIPLFFFISGFLYFYSTLKAPETFTQFTTKKAIRLLLPYFAVSSIAYPLKVLLSSFALRPLGFSIEAYATSLLLPWNNTIIFFWFLPTLFMIFVLARLVLLSSNKWVDLLLLGVFVGLHFLTEHHNTEGLLAVLNLGGVLHNFVYFLLGYLVCKYRANLIEDFRALMIFTLIYAVNLVLYYYGFVAEHMHFMLAVSGIFTCCFAVTLVPSKFLLWLGQYSFQIYLLSWFPQIASRILFGQILSMNIFVGVFMSVALGLLVPIAITQLVKKFNYKSIKMAIGLN